MPRRQGRDLYTRQLRAGARSGRYVDLCVEFVEELRTEAGELELGEVLLRAGGRWDRALGRYTDAEPREVVEVRVHPGQRAAVLWFREWLEAYLRGEDLDPAVYSALLLGGWRSGKTWIGVRLLLAFTVAVPGARVWAVQEVDVERADELQTELRELLPDAWFRVAGSRYRCANGSTITIRSAQHPHKLKRGRCDFALLNEAQNVGRMAFAMLQGRAADTSGLVVCAANPPNDNPEGEWVAEMQKEAVAGRRPDVKLFELQQRDNPHVNREQLEALRSVMSARDYAIEVEGKVLPFSNAVFHAFDLLGNVQPLPELPGADVTAEFAYKRGLGRNVTHLVGLDFQRSPHMAGVVAKAIRNPADPARPLLCYFEEILVELGDEHDLSNGLFELGLDPETTAIVADASGDWQDADRNPRNSSWAHLRKHRWRRLFHPDPDTRANPRVHERVKNDNRLFEAQDGVRLVLIDPRCEALVAACRNWRTKGGVPAKHSEHAHIGEAMGYLNFRLYPWTVRTRRITYETIRRSKRREQLRGL